MRKSISTIFPFFCQLFSTLLLIFDDLMDDILKSKIALEICTVGSHHRNITIVLILQNLYHSGKFSKTIMMNTQYMLLMNNSRDVQQVRYLGRQLGMDRTLEEAYKDCLSRPYGYLLVDLSPHNINPLLKLKTYIFPNEYLTVYLPMQ